MQLLGTEHDILDQLDGAIAIADAGGRVVRWNRQAESLYGWAPEEPLGRDLFQATGADSALDADLRERILAGERWRGDYVVWGRNGGPTTVHMNVTPLRQDGGAAPVGFVSISVDVTERRRIEARLALQYGVTQGLAKSDSLAEAGPRILRSICESVGWEVGAIWVVEDGGGEEGLHESLRCDHLFQVDPAATGEFAEETRRTRFRRGIGLPGRVMAARADRWVLDAAVESNFPRGKAAARAGLRSGLAFPVLLGGEVLGVLEFFTREVREPDEGLRRMMAGIGGQIGQFLERKEAERSVRQSEARKSAILRVALDAIVSMDRAGRVVEWNPAAERIFGYRREEVLGHDMADLIIPPDLRGRHREALERHLATGEGPILGRRLELTGQRADGTQFPVELTVTAVSTDPPLFTGFVRDITDRKQAEMQLTRVLGAEEQARTQAESAQQRLSFLAEAGVLLSSAMDFGSALQALGRLAVSLLADICLIDIVDELGELQRLVAVASNPEQEELTRLLERRYAPTRGGRHPAARVIETGKPAFSPEMTDEFLRETTRDEEHFRITKRLGMTSYVCVPLVARGRILGTITLVSTNPDRRFGAAAVSIAEDLARRAGLTVDNVRLLEAEQRARRRAERAADRTTALQAVTAAMSEALGSSEVAHTVLAQASEQFGAATGALAVLDAGAGDVRLIEAIGYDPAAIEPFRRFALDAPLPLAEAIRQRAAVFVQSHEEMLERFPDAARGAISRAIACAPLLIDGRATGALSLGFAHDRRFTDEDIQFLQALARQAAHALERARLYEAERAARDEAEAARRELAFMAEASTVLAAGVLDYEMTLANVARLAVPFFADWCVVDLAGEAGSIQRVALAHSDPQKEELGRRLRERYPPDPNAPTGVPNVLRTGQPEVYAELSDELLRRTAVDPDQLAILRSLGLKSSMVVPLVARGRTFGAITFVRAESGRRYGEHDLLLAEELARRAAIAVDNARLYHQERTTAHTLQQSLLPPKLPAIPGVEVAARYRPAGQGTEIGGDFYDLFETADGGWAVVMGDVCGKGVEAAAVTGLVRHSLRAVGRQPMRPAEALRALNDTLLHHEAGDRFCTLVCVHLRPNDLGAHASVSSGGHPLPFLVRPDGTVAPAGRPGTLLGVFPDPSLVDVDLDLRPGDALVLYTDGVTEERRGEEIFGDERLRAALAGAAGGGAGAIATAVEEAVGAFRTEEPRDDLAILVLRVVGATVETPAPVADETG